MLIRGTNRTHALARGKPIYPQNILFSKGIESLMELAACLGTLLKSIVKKMVITSVKIGAVSLIYGAM